MIGRRSPRLLALIVLATAARAWAGFPVVAPVITSTAAANGGALSDTAHVSGGNHPTGSLTFALFGPNDATCTNPSIGGEILTLDGDGDYTTDAIVAPAPGTYRWTISYPGDVNNGPVVVPCNATNESVTITPVTPTLTTTATSGFVISDVAHLTGGNHPTGTLQFLAYGPDDATCSGIAIAPEPLLVGGNGNYPSGPITPPGLGTYRWTASYSGDVANDPVSTSCNDPNETSTATTAPTVPTLGPGALAALAALVAAAGASRARG